MNILIRTISHRLAGFCISVRRCVRNVCQTARCRLLVMVLALTVCLTLGCYSRRAARPAADYYYLNPHKKLTTIGRVAIVELENDSSYPDISADITGSLFRALQKRQVFGLTIIRRDDPSWRGLQLEGDSTYSLDQIRAIRETLKCNGVLLGTVTEFRPYPHMGIGLRLKLLDMRDGQLLWALEQVWDSSDKTIKARTRDYFETEKGLGFEPLNEKLITVSPIEFLKFVSYEVAETL
ncbi:MAG: hypothetical protein JSW47_00565 [Phycisphaerales bacterium]|nr:MAG: hypothetical protein JSW47_00565 [Phycisphaerales bacterium]